VKTVFLNGDVATRAAAIDILATHLGFPAHAARNLDALYDVLRTEIAGPFAIVWRGHARARAARAAEFDTLIEVLTRVAAERADMQLTLA
jgi:ribonuclease inhibitor